MISGQFQTVTFQCISVNVLKLASRVWFQTAGIMFPAKIKTLVSYSVTVKALLQYGCTINQERLCYLWKVSPSWRFPTASFPSSLFSACYFFLTVIAGRTVSRQLKTPPTSESMSVCSGGCKEWTPVGQRACLNGGRDNSKTWDKECSWKTTPPRFPSLHFPRRTEISRWAP